MIKPSDLPHSSVAATYDGLFRRWIDKVRVGDPHNCWLWTASVSKGYGQLFKARGRPPWKAHRLAFLFAFGRAPIGNLLHSCDTPACVNPNHLREGDQRDNMMDASNRDRLNPRSLSNLRPGAPGYRGAGPIPNEARKCEE